ncbi:hypothetical protein KFK09_006503 [Dendrobium nobile]|uniref:Uncharacterized protein n=1 Tax=Dendrobium nobile TaxID=94219 RepID=A0A8T3BU51_DENNO|nr:hypothetical protein KFK09_006503 [Dendrobium nobile]
MEKIEENRMEEKTKEVITYSKEGRFLRTGRRRARGLSARAGDGEDGDSREQERNRANERGDVRAGQFFANRKKTGRGELCVRIRNFY